LSSNTSSCGGLLPESLTTLSDGYFYRVRGTRHIVETIGEQADDDLFVRVHLTRQQFAAQELLNHDTTDRKR
jgi:hypothetical protein